MVVVVEEKMVRRWSFQTAAAQEKGGEIDDTVVKRREVSNSMYQTDR